MITITVDVCRRKDLGDNPCLHLGFSFHFSFLVWFVVLVGYLDSI